jgi:hypothetical protein
LQLKEAEGIMRSIKATLVALGLMASQMTGLQAKSLSPEQLKVSRRNFVRSAGAAGSAGKAQREVRVPRFGPNLKFKARFQTRSTRSTYNSGTATKKLRCDF